MVRFLAALHLLKLGPERARRIAALRAVEYRRSIRREFCRNGVQSAIIAQSEGEESMCGRYTVHHKPEEIAERFEVDFDYSDYTPRYNIAPSQMVATIRQIDVREVAFCKWGLIPFWAKDPSIGNKMINAKAETLAEKPSFKNALAKRRCLIPADGFYEWKK